MVGVEAQTMLIEANLYVPNQMSLAYSDTYMNSNVKYSPQNKAALVDAAAYGTVGDWSYVEDGEWINGWADVLNTSVRDGNMTLDDARGILSLDEYNELGDYGNMQYGYGNGYDMGASAFDPESFEVNGAISPADWNRSIENRYTSLPGYGLASVGDDRAIARYLYDAGYQEQEGVPELWASYYGEDTSEEE